MSDRPAAVADPALSAPMPAAPPAQEQPWHGNLPALVPQAMPLIVSEATLSPAARAEVERVAESADLSSTAGIMIFGAAPQQRLSSYLDTLVRDDTIGAAGLGGEITAELSRGMSRINLKGMRSEVNGEGISGKLASVLGGLPVVGRHFSALRAFLIDRARLADEFGRIEQKARGEKARLIDATARFDGMVRELEALIESFKVYLAAGVRVRDREAAAYAAERAAIEAAPPSERDPARAARLRDRGERIAQFEVRLVRMHAAYLEAIQNIPEIRNLSKASEIGIQDVMESMLSDIPRLKRAVIQMIGLSDLKKARQNSEARRKLSIELGNVASEATRDAYLSAKASQGNFDDELGRLDHAAQVLLDTLQKAAVLDQENKAKREQARLRIVSMKDAFVRDMTEMQRAV